nr:hypothetical protein [uncultured Parolsenella sp.]
MGMGFMPASPSCIERASCDCERCGDGKRDGGEDPVPSAAKPAARVDEATEGMRPIVVIAAIFHQGQLVSAAA